MKHVKYAIALLAAPLLGLFSFMRVAHAATDDSPGSIWGTILIIGLILLIVVGGTLYHRHQFLQQQKAAQEPEQAQDAPPTDTEE